MSSTNDKERRQRSAPVSCMRSRRRNSWIARAYELLRVLERYSLAGQDEMQKGLALKKKVLNKEGRESKDLEAVKMSLKKRFVAAITEDKQNQESKARESSVVEEGNDERSRIDK